MNIAIIVAAGAGERMRLGRAKQFLDLCGEPLLLHTLRPFEQCVDVDQVILALPAEQRETFAARLSAWGLTKVTNIVEGGAERQDSVWQALRRVDVAATELVIIHDGARPLITGEQISRVIGQARRSGAAILALPVTDTVKEVEAGRVVCTLDRRRLYLAQTPQAFRADIIVKAHRRARQQGVRATDDAALVERLGLPVMVVEGSRSNLKVTWPDDLARAEILLKRD